MYITRNVLRIFFSIAACVMFQFSSWFKILSDYLKTTEKADDSPKKTVENRCDANSFSNHTNKNEEQKGSNKVIDIVNGLLDTGTKECNDQSVFNNNIVAEQKIVNGVIANIVNCKLEEGSDSQHYEVEQKPMSQNPGESKDNSNSEDSVEKVKEEEKNCEDIGSTRARKRHPIKNTAMLLITKTINENKLMDKRFKCELKLNIDKMSNKEIPNGNPYRDKDKMLTNKSDSFISETKLSLNSDPEKTDCFEVSNNSHSKDTYIESGSEYMNDGNILDIQKNIELMENQCKTNGNEQLITINNVDCCENDNSNEIRNLTTKTENMIKEINDEHLKNYNGYENKNPITQAENMTTKYNDFYWKDFDDFDNRKLNTKTEHMANNSEHWDNNNIHEYSKPIPKTENTMLNIFEVNDDIFGLPSKFSLAHCVCEDFHNSMGMTADFKYKFGKYGALMDQHLRVSDVGHILHDEQHIFYLVVKRKVAQKPLLSSLEIALYNLRDKMNDLKLTKLAIPKYGLDTFNMADVKELISKVFILSNIEVTLCLAPPKLDVEHFNPPKVNYTYKHLWEMEKQTDLIIFININTVYSANWNDKVVEHINAKYPFKERLLKDINIKPMAHGDLLTYKIDSEVLFCIFIKPLDQNSAYFRCLEKAFQEMKSQMTGYRYLGIQQEPISYRSYQHTLPRTLCTLKSVFSVQNAEIWICGDTEQHKALNYQQYKNIVNDAIEVNQKRNSKTNARSKHRSERKKRESTNSNNSKHELSEKYNSKNTLDVNAVPYLNQDQITVDNYITENWDN